MSTNWGSIWDSVYETKSQGELEKLLKANGVGGNDVFPLIRSAVRAYARSREYHKERQSSMSALIKENRELKKLAEAKK